MNRRFALGMAAREARSAGPRLLLYASSMALGIAALVALQGMRGAVESAVAAHSRALLGADVRLESRAPFADEAGALLAELEAMAEAPVAHVTRFGSMLLAPATGRTRLLDVRGVDPAYPFYGVIETEPPGLWGALQSDEPLALLDPGALIQLDAKVGDRVLLGELELRILGTVVRSPGIAGLRASVAPRVFVARRHVATTGLLQRGSMVDYHAYLRVETERLHAWLELKRPALDAAHVREDTVEEEQRDASGSFAALARYLGLIGLAGLLLGGIGVAAGVRVWVREKIDAVAVLRALGASSRDVLATYGLLALGLGAVAGASGALLGTLLQAGLPQLIAGLLPVAVVFRPDPLAIATGIALGLWVTSIFVAGPLVDLARVPPLRVLRRDFDAEPTALAGRAAQLAAVAVSLLGVALWQAPTWRVGFAFAGGLAGVLAVLAGASWALAAWLRRRRLARAPFWLRQGLANLFRPRNHTLATTLAIGFGLHIIATLHAVQANVRAQIALDTRPDRPNLVLFDVQHDQLAELERLLDERGAPVLEQAPLVSARIARVRDREAADTLRNLDPERRELRWALRREYRLTWSAGLRDTETLVEGEWWNGAPGNGSAVALPSANGGAVPVSLETELAGALGARVGDTIVWDVQGVPVPSIVTSLRSVDWARLAPNFMAVFPPGVLESAPGSRVLLLRVPGEQARALLQRDIVTRFPNVSALDAARVLDALDQVLAQVGAAVRSLSWLSLASGFLILLAAAAASRHERAREALLLRTLGASSGLVRRVSATESIALGALASLVGVGTSVLASAGLVVWLFELPYRPPWGELVLLGLASWIACASLGAWLGRPIARSSPLAGLRESGLR